MLERTYRATRFDEALARVRRDLGPDAFIVSSRQIRKGGYGAAGEVEVTAVTQAPSAPPRAASWGVAPPRSEPSSSGNLERRLARMGVPDAAAILLTKGIRALVGGEPRTMGELRTALARVLEDEMLFAAGLDHRVRVAAFVGPTGVGKTTTIAKIAARAALVEQRQVALVSIDQYRVGGVEQLERWADLIGVPMETAHDGATLSAALERLGGADLVLVDTAGRTPRDAAAIADMGKALQGAGEPIEVHLCLAAATHPIEVEALAERMAALRPVRLAVTKVDEAVRAGGIVGAHAQTGLPLSYFTTGQRVPEDLEDASAEGLAAFLCGEEVN
jgi:flagellar biosynthesis protein FlhF